jgi:predicted unusual protein kinase regulating ubiquinone biosynthesis (AarF/ABC1/UbiB family)
MFTVGSRADETADIKQSGAEAQQDPLILSIRKQIAGGQLFIKTVRQIRQCVCMINAQTVFMIDLEETFFDYARKALQAFLAQYFVVKNAFSQTVLTHDKTRRFYHSQQTVNRFHGRNDDVGPVFGQSIHLFSLVQRERRQLVGRMPYIAHTHFVLMQAGQRVAVRMLVHTAQIPRTSTDADHRRQQLSRFGAAAWVRLRIARLRSRFVGEEKQREIRQQAIVQTADDALEVMGSMKGAMMKLAQFASFQPGMPEQAREKLKALQADAPTMSSELAAQCVVRELGAHPSEVFGRFDLEPIAAASIGQVHRARTKDGREVAVKIQYPGVDDAIRSDLDNAGMFIKTMTTAMQEDVDFSSHLAEVAQRVGEELDYVAEASYQRRFAETYAGHPFVQIPDVLDELTTPRVLTTSFVEGRRFYDVLSDGQDTRNRIGEIIFRFAFNSVFVHGLFSGDPHPGNYLFPGDGRVCFLDFGLVKQLDPSEREILTSPMKAMLTGDRRALRESLGVLGVLRPGSEVDEELLWELFVQILGPVDADRVVRCEMDEPRRDEGRRERFRALRNEIDFPADVIFFMRYRRGTWAVLSHLGAEANWHRILREIVFGEAPSTEIGAAWSESRALSG